MKAEWTSWRIPTLKVSPFATSSTHPSPTGFTTYYTFSLKAAAFGSIRPAKTRSSHVDVLVFVFDITLHFIAAKHC